MTASRQATPDLLRRTVPDVDDPGSHVASTLLGHAPAYRPEDVRTGTRSAALTAIDSGITTVLDFSHNSRTAAHPDAAVRALRDTGIRGAHAAMGPNSPGTPGSWVSG
ncbi:hypothetical protein [Saccharothrix xinjiangensis]|uniref:Uncharacterized protein n=1 Tax=Saccharothrix xinjiangensis TaxID=204798 RepID=A0ABV9Y409_9PSEU